MKPKAKKGFKGNMAEQYEKAFGYTRSNMQDKLAHTSKTPLYSISATSRLTGIPIVTLRWIEKQGLITPARTQGRQRLYSDNEIAALGKVRDLLDEQINLPGVRMVLRLQKELKQSQDANRRG